MNQKKLFFCIFAITFIIPFIKAQPNAFCSKPIADLVGTSMSQARKQQLPVKNYNEQPFSDKSGDYACTRLSQLLFNEQVEIIEQVGNELKVKIFHWYHQAGTPPVQISKYWVQKEAITPFKELTQKEKQKLPDPIVFEQKKLPTNDIVTLTKPFKNFSAGTRFVKASKQKNKHSFMVYAYNSSKKQFETIKIPTKFCIDQVPQTTKGKRKLFVSLLKAWVHEQTGYTPYVFGGASIGNPHKRNSYMAEKIKTPKKTVTFFNRRGFDQINAKSGIDCAHTIARAAQIAGIKYFVKNTSTMKKVLKPLAHNESIEDGDILVWRGHTVVVSDAKKGLLIEARGYDHGYGILQEIPFSEQFKNIQSSKQLKLAFLKNKKIDRLNKDGKKVQTIDDLMIIKLPVS